MFNPRALTANELHAARCISGSTFAMNYGPCAVYVGELERNGATVFVAAGYVGKAAKASFFYSFRTMQKLGEHADKWAADMVKSAQYKAARVQERNAFQHTLQVGDVLYTSWGYDQTNIDYYQVTKLVGSKMVEVCEIASQSVDGAHYMTGESVPNVGKFVGKPMRCRVGEGNCAKVDGHHASPVRFSLVGGVKIYTPKYWSAYA